MMDCEKAAAYLKKMAEDGDLQQRMERAKSPEECLEIVNACGFDFELDEFKDLMQKILFMVKKETGQELTDEELALAAGGLSETEQIGLGVSIGVAVTATAIVGVTLAASAAV